LGYPPDVTKKREVPGSMLGFSTRCDKKNRKVPRSILGFSTRCDKNTRGTAIDAWVFHQM
jgi:hypothetical protein